jgi:hypothetical protein
MLEKEALSPMLVAMVKSVKITFAILWNLLVHLMGNGNVAVWVW